MQVDDMDDFRMRGRDRFPKDRIFPPWQQREEPNFTPLNKSLTKILKEIRTRDFFVMPTPMRTPAEKMD